MKEPQIYYFAYGSNMSFKELVAYCPSRKYLKRCHVPDYRFVYDGYSITRGGPVGNIVETKGCTVWGGLFEIEKKEKAALNRKEGAPTSYREKEITVYDEQGNIFNNVITYIRDPLIEGVPPAAYLHIVLTGAKDCNLPKDYIDQYLSRI